MPDVGMLLELSEVLKVTVDEILRGENAKKVEVPYEGGIFHLAVERAEKKIEGFHIRFTEILGVLCFILAGTLIAVQIWYVIRGRSFGLVYLTEWIPAVMAAVSVLLLWLGGFSIRKIRKIWMKPGCIAAAGILFAGGIGISLAGFRVPGQQIVSLAPDLSHVMSLQVDASGRAVFYRQRGGIFAVQADVFPFTVKEKVKVQWLEDDVCALTYESPDDGGTHQYVATYGDRNGGVSYYYVFNAAYGKWRAEGNYDNYSMEITDGPDAGIVIHTPEGSEQYDVDECLQYGTLALVFPSDAPKWTLVLNKDCRIGEGSGTVEEGGTLTLCRVGMDKTAPLVMH